MNDKIASRSCPLSSRWLPLGLVLLVIIGGAWMTVWRSRMVDAEMRSQLLSQAVALAQTVNPEQLRSLSFTADDRSNPAYQALRQQMIAYGKFTGLKSIYSQAMRSGAIVFGPESLETNSPYASAPGDIYKTHNQEFGNISHEGTLYAGSIH